MKQLLLIITIAVLAFTGCSGEQESAEQEFGDEEIAGRVDDWVVTRYDVQDAIDKLEDYKRAELDNDAGRASVTDLFIQEQLFYREAQRLNLDRETYVQKQIHDATRRILIAAYFKEYVEGAARPTEEEIHDYYESHQDQYTMLAVARGQHIFSKSREILVDIKERVIEGGEKFTTMAHRYSEDGLTKADGGDLGYFNPGGYVRGFGYNHAIADSMFQMDLGIIYGPIEWEKGYSLIRINERRQAELRPYVDVRDEIEQTLIQEKLELAKAKVTEEISSSYNVENHFEEYYLTVQRSPEELFSVAQTADDPQIKIMAYKEIAEKFPDDDIAPKALFMVGFVQAEELKDYLSADRTFTQVVLRYPDTDVADQAKWMIDNLQSGTPDFDKIEQELNGN